MEQYPSISNIITDQTIYAFDKLDGSNIRVEWTRKGMTKFGSRTRLLDKNEQPLGEAVNLIMEYEDSLSRIFRKSGAQKVTAFFEFAGDNSFAGYHEEEEHRVVLLDIFEYKKGIMSPRDFMRQFEGIIPIPSLLYQGKANNPFTESVHDGTLEGMTFEGVVCKGGTDKYGRVSMFKVKNKAWLQKLKGFCGNDEALYEKLS